MTKHSASDTESRRQASAEDAAAGAIDGVIHDWFRGAKKDGRTFQRSSAVLSFEMCLRQSEHMG